MKSECEELEGCVAEKASPAEGEKLPEAGKVGSSVGQFPPVKEHSQPEVALQGGETNTLTSSFSLPPSPRAPYWPDPGARG